MMDALPRPPPDLMATVEAVALAVEAAVGENPAPGTVRVATIYRIRRDPSLRPQYLVAVGPRLLDLGERRLFVRVLSDLSVLRGVAAPGHFELAALQKMAKAQGLPTHWDTDDEKVPKKPEELVDSLEGLHLELDRLLFSEEVSPYSREELLALGEDLPAALDLALRGGWVVDEDLAFAFKPLLVPVDPARVPPRPAMRTAPHEIVVTGTKAGKSSIASRLGRVVERPTPAGLLGFADSGKRVSGVLHGASRPVLVDEIAQEPLEEAARAISTYLEVGEVEVSRGIGLRVRGWAPVVFLANPPPGTDTFASALESFLAVLRALTSTQAEALGSRQALLLFKPRIRPAEPEGALEAHALAKAEALLTSFQAHAAPLVSEALHHERVLQWLSEGFPTAHSERIRRAAEGVAYPEVAAFLRGYAESHRHARGLALRSAFVDTAFLHLEAGEVQMQALLTRADEIFPRLVALREESLQELVHVAADEKLRRGTLRTRYLALPYEYLKRAVAAIALWSEGPDQEEGLVEAPVPFEAVRDAYLGSPLYERQGRWTFPRLADTVNRNVNPATELVEPFGLRFSSGQYGVEFRVRDLRLFGEAMEEIRGCISGSEKEGGVEPTSATSSTSAQARARRENLPTSKPSDVGNVGTLQSKRRQPSAGFDPDLGTKQGSADTADTADVPPVSKSLVARTRKILRREKSPIAGAFIAKRVEEDQGTVEVVLGHLRQKGEVQVENGLWRWIGR